VSDWKKPNGLFVIQPHEIQAFLLPLSVGHIPGVGKVTEERMKQAGIKTVGECFGDLALIENRQGGNRPQSHVRDTSFTSRWTGFVNTADF
jgi:DNA polymerase IV